MKIHNNESEDTLNMVTDMIASKLANTYSDEVFNASRALANQFNLDTKDAMVRVTAAAVPLLGLTCFMSTISGITPSDRERYTFDCIQKKVSEELIRHFSKGFEAPDLLKIIKAMMIIDDGEREAAIDKMVKK